MTTIGTVTGATGIGVRAVTEDGGGTYAEGNIQLFVADVNGGTTGIYANNRAYDSTGTMKVTATGTVTGANGIGIHAINAANSHGVGVPRLTIWAADVSGTSDGIRVEANRYETKLTSITAGSVIGTNQDGVDAFTQGRVGLKISTADGTGG